MDLFQQKHIKGWIPVYQENYTGPERREQRDNKTLTVSRTAVLLCGYYS